MVEPVFPLCSKWATPKHIRNATRLKQVLPSWIGAGNRQGATIARAGFQPVPPITYEALFVFGYSPASLNCSAAAWTALLAALRAHWTFTDVHKFLAQQAADHPSPPPRPHSELLSNPDEVHGALRELGPHYAQLWREPASSTRLAVHAACYPYTTSVGAR